MGVLKLSAGKERRVARNVGKKQIALAERVVVGPVR
jgi:hypothetical protein